MLLFIVFGSVFLFFSVLFFFSPKLIVKISEVGNRLLFTDHNTVAHRYWSGLILLIMSLVMFYLSVLQ
jgi:hypothetical protein